MRRALERVVRVLGSFGLACVLFLLLLVVVLVGTLEQQRTSLFEVQETYFASLWFVFPVADTIPIPFPGGALLLGVLCANLVVGGLLRLRWSARTSGIVVTHLGILLLLAGGFVEYRMSQKGFLHLEEGEAGDRFFSWDEWELAVVRRGAEPREWVVPAADVRASEGERLVARAPDLPFDVRLSGYALNTTVREARSADVGIDGVELVALPGSTNEKRPNVPGALAALVGKDGATLARGFLRGGESAYAWTATVRGATFDVSLRRRAYAIPFTTRLDKTLGEELPGTGIPRRFSSYVAVTDGDLSRDVHITMNEPLRRKGMTLYQSGFTPRERTESGRAASTFAVVYNPSDSVPLIACIVIGLGLSFHFGLRLARHLDAEGKRRAAASAPVAGAAR